MNSTSAFTFFNGNTIYSQSGDVPFYYADRPALIPGVPDRILALVAPITGYWILSLFFHGLDMSGWQWLNEYRIHAADNVKTRKLATRSEVILAVVVQQAIQTMFGYFMGLIRNAPTRPGSWRGEMEDVRTVMVRIVVTVLGSELGKKVLQGAEMVDLVYFLYWWGIPAAQLFVAMLIADTWEYFVHRFIHMNQFLYKNIHSVHHRIYVPYAFGAMYNHPIETFLMDAPSDVVGKACALLSVRQSNLFWTFSNLKTVDDHCGYRLPFDPFQLMSGNNADFHDIHHQAIGMRANFSTLFFTHWDVLFGTRMTRKDIELRRRKVGKVA
jgi:sphinganine C4-monooxygenase